MRGITLVLGAALGATLLFPQERQAPTVESMPPVVVRTVPEAGAVDVDPGITEIRVTFSKKMTDGSWSWSTAWQESSPEITGKPHYLEDGRTCVAPVKLEAGRTYGFWLNSQRFGNFKDKEGQSAVPYLLVFRTAAKATQAAAPGEPKNDSDYLLVTDYGSTRVVIYDAEGKETWRKDDLFDPLDAEITPAGTILVTEQGDNAVRIYGRDGKKQWEFKDLSHPLDADWLPNGHVLIADPGNWRVIEVDAKGTIVWSYGRTADWPSFKPYDADRLANGNTLIADYGSDRVVEVDAQGKTVWCYPGCKFVCDADRLANGNTLITTRQPPQVVEVTPDSAVVWKLEGLQLPWDADRWPDGSTAVAENFRVGIYDRNGKLVRKFDAEWASEANLVPKSAGNEK